MTLRFSRTEKYLLGLGLALGLLMMARVHALGLDKALTDENSHLNFSRLFLNSMTPGLSQIGFWPPLLHILMAPFTYIPWLYKTGFAAPIVLIPIMLMGMIFLYRTIMRLTDRESLAATGAILFLVNPFVLYYSVTPMMEVLFLANLFATAYFLVAWLQTDKLKYLLWCGIFISLASLSRYEGLILIPVVASIVVAQLIRKHSSWRQIEALVILFSLLTFLAVGFIGFYGLVFAGTPLAFMGGSWLKTTGTVFNTQHNFVQTIIYILHASYYMISQPLVWIALGSFLVLMIASKKRFIEFAVLVTLASPILFVALALFSGSYSVAVPELPPYGFFNNDRYGLTWIGFAILAPILLVNLVLEWWPYISKKHWATASTALVAIAGLLAVPNLYEVAFTENFWPIAADINVPSPGQIQVADYLSSHYDYGKILITRSDNDPVLSSAGIDLSNYIYEGNYRFFDQTLQQPWLFARWVVMYNTANKSDAWSMQNEKISAKWGSDPQFLNFYTLVDENATRRIYKVDDAKVADLANSAHYNISAIPSINKKLTWWNPGNIYAEIENSRTTASASLR